MNKKLIITESQYERLQNLLVETPFDEMVKSSVEVGDIIRITWKGSESNFEVINNTTGQIIMDNIDKGSTNINYRYLLTFTSLDGDDLSGKRVHKTKEAHKLDNPKTWSNISVKDITNIEVIRDGKVIDKVDPVSPSAEKQQKMSGDGSMSDGEKYDEINNNLGIILEQIDEGKGLKLMFSNTLVIFCCVGRSGNIIDLEIAENKSITSLNKWNTLSLTLNDGDDLFKDNKSVVRTTDKGQSFGLKLDVRSGNETSKIWLNGIVGVSVTNKCDGKEDYDSGEKSEEDLEKEKLDLEKEKEAQRAEAQRAFNMIVNDKDLQDAFYSEPSFWKKFVAELKGEKAVGNGIIVALDLINKYKTKRTSEKLGDGFKVGKDLKIFYKPLDEISINYLGKTFELERNKNYTQFEDAVKTVNFDASDYQVGEYTPYDKLLINKLKNFEFIVKEKTTEPDVFMCDVIFNYKDNKKSERAVQKDVKIKFLNSEGYTPINK
jgi:hypothetical protein